MTAAGSDDAEESASGSVSLTSTDLELVHDSSDQTVGMRFAGVNIPQGATIVNASVQFVVDETTSETTTLTFQAQASDNAPTFTATANNISSRPGTTASVPWSPAAWNTLDQAGPDQRTPNLAPVVQEIVDRPGWTSGNALAILITGSGKRVARSYERDVYGAPYLHIEYTLQTPQLQLQITPNPTSFTGSGQSIGYTYTLTNTGDVPLSGPYTVSDDTISSVDCSSAVSPLAVDASTTCTGSYTTTTADVTAGSITNSATASASFGPQAVTSNVATATVTLQIPPLSVTINYVYDKLYRLEEANYSNNDYYHYTYDAVGNRLTQDKMIIGFLTTDIYVPDDANRLASVNGVNYTWDANGNLLSDGVTTYTYDFANRLKTMTSSSVTASYAYNGLNDRLQQIVNGQTTTFTMDLNTGLTQALSDGTNTSIYGNGRIAQVNTGTEYFLGDALGSVRQLTNSNGAVTYASTYDPYGVTTQTYGASQTAYGYTGEYTSNDMVYLRARMYSPEIGHFLTRDTWGGDENSPMSFNQWNYVAGNPINRTDPSGHCYNPNGSWDSRLPLSVLCPTNSSGLSITLPSNVTATVTDAGCPPAQTSISPISPDCDGLGPLGADACRTYTLMRDNPGWWSKGSWNKKSGNFSPQAFLGFLVRMEFNGYGHNGFNDIDGGVQAETIVRNFYYRCPYWSDCTGNFQSAHDIFSYVAHRKLLSTRLGIQALPRELPPGKTWSEVIDAAWHGAKDVEAYSTVDFEDWFLHPAGAWSTGKGNPINLTRSGSVYANPVEWGNASMFSPRRLGEAQRLLRDHPEHARGLAENQFFRAARSIDNPAVIVTWTQCMYWKETTEC